MLCFGGEKKNPKPQHCIELQLHLIGKLLANTKIYLELLKKGLFDMVTYSWDPV